MKIRRSYILKLLLITALALPMWSCIWDGTDCNGTGDDGNGFGYFTVSIVFSDDNMPKSRAAFDGSDTYRDDNYFFNNGIEEESRISTDPNANRLLVYDAAGNIITRLSLTSFVADETSQNGQGKSYKALCRIPASSGLLDNMSYMRIILNASRELQEAIDSGEDLDELLISQSSTGDTDYLFLTATNDNEQVRYNTMSSSIVVKDSKATTAITMNEKKYYPTPDEALASPCATLYVERLQAKYTVLFRPDATSGKEQYLDDNEVWDYTPSTETSEKSSSNVIVFSPTMARSVYYVTSFDVNDNMPQVRRGYWKASIVGWSINGTEPSEYLFKNFGNSAGSFSSWNFTSNSPIRNLWAVDPNYDEDPSIYPDQYRTAFDISTTSAVNSLNAYEAEPEKYPLNYLSFNQLMKRDIRQYSAENTFDAGVVFLNQKEYLENRAQYRCGNHLVIGAQLLINGMDDDAIYNPTSVDEQGLIVAGDSRVKSKYFMDNIYWSEDAYINYYSRELANNLDATTKCLSDLVAADEPFIPNDVFQPAENDTKFYVNDNGSWRVADSRDFTIEHVYIIGGDGWCYPVPKHDDKGQTILYVHQANGYRQITVEEYNKFAYGYPFYFAKGYIEGRMYYAVPISNNETRENAPDFGLTTGDYGAVRNHWYHYRFTGLTSVGVSIHNPDQPIVPNNEPSILGLGFEVRIIPWHVVDEDVKI